MINIEKKQNSKFLLFSTFTFSEHLNFSIVSFYIQIKTLKRTETRLCINRAVCVAQCYSGEDKQDSSMGSL